MDIFSGEQLEVLLIPSEVVNFPFISACSPTWISVSVQSCVCLCAEQVLSCTKKGLAGVTNLNTLLQNIDKLPEGNILLAATNHHNLLDSAVWRRFSKILSIGMPSRCEIEKLLLSFLPPSLIVLKNDKQREILIDSFLGLSPSAIKTISENAKRKMILSHETCISFADVLREIYLFRHHELDDIGFIKFLLIHKIPHKEINALFYFPLRKIQDISKTIERGDSHE